MLTETLSHESESLPYAVRACLVGTDPGMCWALVRVGHRWSAAVSYPDGSRGAYAHQQPELALVAAMRRAMGGGE